MVKNEYLLRKRLHTSWVPGPTKKIYKKKSIYIDIRQAKMCVGDQASEGGAEGKEGEWASSGVPGSP